MRVEGGLVQERGALSASERADGGCKGVLHNAGRVCTQLHEASHHRSIAHLDREVQEGIEDGRRWLEASHGVVQAGNILRLHRTHELIFAFEVCSTTARTHRTGGGVRNE